MIIFVISFCDDESWWWLLVELWCLLEVIIFIIWWLSCLSRSTVPLFMMRNISIKLCHGNLWRTTYLISSFHFMFLIILLEWIWAYGFFSFSGRHLLRSPRVAFRFLCKFIVFSSLFFVFAQNLNPLNKGSYIFLWRRHSNPR